MKIVVIMMMMICDVVCDVEKRCDKSCNVAKFEPIFSFALLHTCMQSQMCRTTQYDFLQRKQHHMHRCIVLRSTP